MSLTVTIGICTDDNRVVSKTYTTLGTYTGMFPKEDLDIMHPVIDVTYNSIENLMTTANYMYISELNRYYYITNKSLLIGNKIRLEGNIDILNTYKEYILNLNTLIVRQENCGITYTVDDKLPLYPIRGVTAYRFPANATFGSDVMSEGSQCFVLQVAGGGSSTTTTT